MEQSKQKIQKKMTYRSCRSSWDVLFLFFIFHNFEDFCGLANSLVALRMSLLAWLLDSGI